MIVFFFFVTLTSSSKLYDELYEALLKVVHTYYTKIHTSDMLHDLDDKMKRFNQYKISNKKTI